MKSIRLKSELYHHIFSSQITLFFLLSGERLRAFFRPSLIGVTYCWFYDAMGLVELRPMK